MAEKRACSGATKAGKPCKAAPLKDRDVCLAHADLETRESTGFVPDNGFGGRPKNPRAVDVLRERLEAELDEWFAVLIRARDAANVKVVGEDEAGPITAEIPDHMVQLRAFTEVFDRVYGKPRQSTEISGPEGGPVRTAGDAPSLDKLSPGDLRDYLALVRKMRGDGGEQ